MLGAVDAVGPAEGFSAYDRQREKGRGACVRDEERGGGGETDREEQMRHTDASTPRVSPHTPKIREEQALLRMAIAMPSSSVN